MKIYAWIIFATMLVVLSGCEARKHDGRLDSVYKMTDTDPQDALHRLDSIDYTALSEADRHFFDLLSIKAWDKAYIQHTSDSVIKKVIAWYGSHRKSGLYPEALYYGGRVYSDIGDYPTALRYFQMALDELPDNTDNLKLRATVMSQMGQLLNLLRLYEEAEPYIEKTIELDRISGDSVNEVNDLHLLGSIQQRSGRYDEAARSFRQALDRGKFMPQLYTLRSRMYLAAAKYYQGQNDTALDLIRHIPESIDSLCKNYALASAANIYLDAGIHDTAYYYAHALISRDDSLNKQTGYHVLLSQELRGYVHPDSVINYAKAYSMLTERRLDENQNQLALIQQSLYNYRQHDKERETAEILSENLKQWLEVVLILLAITGIAFIYQRFRNKRNIKQLQQALDNIEKLKLHLASYINQSLALEMKKNELSGSIKVIESVKNSKETAESLRERLKKELKTLYESSKDQPVSPIILNSEVYGKLQKMIENGKPLKDNDSIWNEIEKVVLESSPDFMANLRLLTLGKLSDIDTKTALLLKCGMRPSQLSTLFVKSNGAIISRRETLSKKIFGEKIRVAELDGIIRLL